MVTPPDIEAQILRYYHAEKWTIGTIAAQLHIHHGVVRRVIAQQTGLGRPPSPATSTALGRPRSSRHVAGEGSPEPAGNEAFQGDARGSSTLLSRNINPGFQDYDAFRPLSSGRGS